MVRLVEDKSFSCSFYLLRREYLTEEQKNVFYYDGCFWTEALALFHLYVEVFSARFESVTFHFVGSALTDSISCIIESVEIWILILCELKIS